MARIIITLISPLFYILFFSLFSHQTMSQPNHMATLCNPIETFNQFSLYELNRNLLLSTFAITSSLGLYQNATIGLFSDTVFGMFLCRGDIDTTSCSVCVETAANLIATSCAFNKRAVIYYQECMIHYSNVDFFSALETLPSYIVFSTRNAPNPNQFNQTLAKKFDQLITEVSSSSLVPYFSKDQELVTQPEGSYEIESMVQCTPDLSTSNCNACLRDAFLRASTCCGSPGFAHIFSPKCLVRYTTLVVSSPPPSLLSPPPFTTPRVSSPPPPSLLSPPPFTFPRIPPPTFLPTTPQSPPPPRGNFPFFSGSISFNVIKGKEIFGRIVVTMAVFVFAFVEL